MLVHGDKGADDIDSYSGPGTVINHLLHNLILYKLSSYDEAENDRLCADLRDSRPRKITVLSVIKLGGLPSKKVNAIVLYRQRSA